MIARAFCFRSFLCALCGFFSSASAVLDAAGLGFLGLGARPQTPEWGTILADNRDYLRDYAWVCVFPGAAIAMSVLGFNLRGEGLGRVLDPKGRV